MTTALEGGERSASHLGRFLPWERPGTHCTGGWMGPRGGLDRYEKSRPPTGIRSPDHPVRSQSLYRLRYPAQHLDKVFTKSCYNKLQKNSSSHFRLCYNRTICYHEQQAQRPAFVPLHMSGRSFVLHFYGRYRSFDP